MDEQTIREAAVTAVADLQLDCEVREIRRASEGDGWCVHFSGDYGQFCDEFRNQFGKDNGPVIVREKLKGHLLKQVTKIRSKTGRSRRPRRAEERKGAGDLLRAPLKMLGDIFSGATDVAGAVMGQAANVTEVARDFTANVAEEINDAGIETQSSSSSTPAPEKKRTLPPGPAPLEITTYAPAAKRVRKKSAKKAVKKSAKKSAKKAAKKVVKKAASKTGGKRAKAGRKPAKKGAKREG